MRETQRRTVGILIFDEVEVLDFCAPFEVFSMARPIGDRGDDARLFTAITIAQENRLITCRGGLLDGRRATTHWASIAWMRETYPTIEIVDTARVVDEGRVITSAGVSAGIDMSLHVVARLHDARVAAETAHPFSPPISHIKICYDIGGEKG